VAHPEVPRGAPTLTEEVRGAGHIGSNPWFGYRMSWPLARLSIAPDSLTLSMWPVTYRFEKYSIRYLLRKQLRSRSALCIVHTNPDFAKSVVFRPRQFSRLESLLTQNGYLVTPDEAGLPMTEPIRHSRAIPGIAYLSAIGGLIAAVIAIGIVVGVVGRR